MKTLRTLLAIIILSGILTASCEKNNGNIQPGNLVNIELKTSQKQVVDSANKFAFDIFKPIITETKGGENLMISPFSISSALSMTMNGAAGETFDAMKKTLRYDGKTLEEINETYLKLMNEMVSVDPLVLIEIANSVWVEKRLEVKSQFMSDLETWYKAEAREFDVTDPGAVDMVNNWIEDKTHDKIKNMLETMDSDLAMLLINAIYFNGKWRHQFEKSETQNKPFFITPGASVQVAMMHQNANLAIAYTGNSTLVELPYGQGNYSMVVMLPDEGATTSDAASLLTQSNWNTWMNNLGNNVTEVDLSFPRFKYEYKRKLNDDLINLGMGIAFSDWADFSKISNTGLAVSFVLHQSFIDVNEEGTEAAAATIVGIRFTSDLPHVIAININKPFLYFIRETTTGTIVFMGQVNDPR